MPTKKSDTTSKVESVKEGAFKATEAAGRIASACTESVAELSIGTVRTFSNLFIDVAEGVSKNVSKAVTDSADTAQRTVDKFLTGLKSDAGKEAPPDESSDT